VATASSISNRSDCDGAGNPSEETEKLTVVSIKTSRIHKVKMHMPERFIVRKRG
jgi:hypothetical protein